MSQIDTLVTAGILCFNTDLRLVEQTLSSLKKSDIEIRVIVGCNSPDQTYQKDLEALTQNYGVEYLAHMENRGFGAGHNEIFARSNSKWYLCCNPDVNVSPTAVSRLLTAAEQLPKPGLIGPKVLNEDGSIQRLSRQHITLPNWITRQLWRLMPTVFHPYEIRFDYERTQEAKFVSGCFFLISREVMSQLHGFDESFFLYCEDADLSRRASVIATNLYVHDSVITHAWMKNWAKSRRALWQEITGLLKYFNKHTYF